MTDGTSGGAAARRPGDRGPSRGRPTSNQPTTGERSGGATVPGTPERRPSRNRPTTDRPTTDRPAGTAPAARRDRRLHLPRHRAQIEALLREHLPDVEVWAYGSRVSGDSHDGSDLDLVLRAPGLDKVPMGPLFDLWDALRESTIPFLVEARDWARLPESFHGEIERDYVVLVEGARRAESGSMIGSAATTPTVDVTTEENPTSRRPRRRRRRARIEKIAEKVAMGPFGSSIKVETFTPSGVPIISGQHLRGARVDDAPGFNFISEEHAERLRGANVQRGDVVFTHRGNIGQVAYIPENSRHERYIISQSQFYMRPRLSEAIPEFIAAYFKTPEGRHTLLANTSQVGVPSIAKPVTYLRSIEIPVPPLSEQRAIAHVLGALDDRIELNRRMNATLEATARALFQSWFVDFDPVRAKMAGRDPGLPKEIADLFPDRLVDSAIGRVPVGWTVAPLTELIDVNPKRLLPRGQVAPYLDMANMPTRGHVPNSVVGRPAGSGMRFTKGDTLVARITPCLENGKTAYVDFLGTREIGWGSTEYIVLKPKLPLPDEFAYCVARSARFRQFAVQNMSGTSGRQRVPAAALAGFAVCAPPAPVAARFGRVARSLFRRASRAVIESRTLAATRDTLLPKLISGKMRVRAEKIVGVVA